jgi:3-hydroxyacyl-CoA dehydrogenase/enoyl-CoA hydratase/3-hydroxybutyryl-CoA epimerase
MVELIIGQETDDATLAKAFDYLLKIRKTPIVVNDGWSFYASRVFGAYANTSGIPPPTVANFPLLQ